MSYQSDLVGGHSKCRRLQLAGLPLLFVDEEHPTCGVGGVVNAVPVPVAGANSVDADDSDYETASEYEGESDH